MNSENPQARDIILEIKINERYKQVLGLETFNIPQRFESARNYFMYIGIGNHVGIVIIFALEPNDNVENGHKDYCQGCLSGNVPLSKATAATSVLYPDTLKSQTRFRFLVQNAIPVDNQSLHTLNLLTRSFLNIPLAKNATTTTHCELDNTTQNYQISSWLTLDLQRKAFVPTKGMKYFNWADQYVPLRSKVKLPLQMMPPNDLDKVGFLYMGDDDKSRCFLSGGGLYDWETTDDPMGEHTRWCPQCIYVRNHKPGNMYLKYMRYIQHLQEPPSFSNCSHRFGNIGEMDKLSGSLNEEELLISCTSLQNEQEHPRHSRYMVTNIKGHPQLSSQDDCGKQSASAKSVTMNWKMPKHWTTLLVGYLLMFIMCSGVKAVDLRTQELDPSVDLAHISENNTYQILIPRFNFKICQSQSQKTCFLRSRDKNARKSCFKEPQQGYNYACFTSTKDDKAYEIDAPSETCAEGTYKAAIFLPDRNRIYLELRSCPTEFFQPTPGECILGCRFPHLPPPKNSVILTEGNATARTISYCKEDYVSRSKVPFFVDGEVDADICVHRNNLHLVCDISMDILTNQSCVVKCGTGQERDPHDFFVCKFSKMFKSSTSSGNSTLSTSPVPTSADSSTVSSSPGEGNQDSSGSWKTALLFTLGGLLLVVLGVLIVICTMGYCRSKPNVLERPSPSISDSDINNPPEAEANPLLETENDRETPANRNTVKKKKMKNCKITNIKSKKTIVNQFFGPKSQYSEELKTSNKDELETDDMDETLVFKLDCETPPTTRQTHKTLSRPASPSTGRCNDHVVEMDLLKSTPSSHLDAQAAENIPQIGGPSMSQFGAKGTPQDVCVDGSEAPLITEQYGKTTPLSDQDYGGARPKTTGKMKPKQTNGFTPAQPSTHGSNQMALNDKSSSQVMPSHPSGTRATSSGFGFPSAQNYDDEDIEMDGIEQPMPGFKNGMSGEDSNTDETCYKPQVFSRNIDIDLNKLSAQKDVLKPENVPTNKTAEDCRKQKKGYESKSLDEKWLRRMIESGKLERRLDDRSAAKIAEMIGDDNVQQLAFELGLTKATYQQVKNNNPDQAQQKIQNLLIKWKEAKNEKATLHALIEALKEHPSVHVEWDQLQEIIDSL